MKSNSFTSALRNAGHFQRSFSRSSWRPSSYELDTISSLNLTKDTSVIYQGFTGKVATQNAIESRSWGTNILGGVSPNKGGTTHLELPVFSSVREAAQILKPQATSIYVPAALAAPAIMDAIAAEIPLVVAVAEGIPIHDMLRVHEVLRTQSKSRLVGPNTPGIIAPPERCRVGFMPYKMYSAGCVGIVSKSGTLSYEAVGATTAAKLGQSLVIGMGGDPLPGTTFVDALRLFFEHDNTKGIILIGEIGGEAEFEAADLIKEYRIRGGNKPIIAMVAGQTAPEGKVMGHAGALLGRGDKTAKDKAVALERAGARVVAHPGEMGGLMQKLLGRTQGTAACYGCREFGQSKNAGARLLDIF